MSTASEPLRRTLSIQNDDQLREREQRPVGGGTRACQITSVQASGRGAGLRNGVQRLGDDQGNDVRDDASFRGREAASVRTHQLPSVNPPTSRVTDLS